VRRAHVLLRSSQGDSPGLLREALARLAGLGTGFANTDLLFARDGAGSHHAVIASFDTEDERDALNGAIAAIVDDVLQVNDLGDRADALTAAAMGGSEIPPGYAPLPGTATPPAREIVDYDEPGGAGAEYETLRPFGVFDRAVFDAVLRVLGSLRGKTVLDVGCGTGRFTRELAREGALVTGTDASEVMLQRARAHDRDGAIRYVRGDANEALPDGPYDVITAFYCVHYLDLASFARRARARLNHEGKLAIASFPHRHFTENIFSQFFPSMLAIDLARFPSVPALRRALVDAGFTGITAAEFAVEMRDDPQPLIERVERKYLSSFHLLPDDEFRAGVRAMRRAWQGQESVSRVGRAVVVCGTAR